MERKLLIAGIDPGATTAYAIFDIDRNLIHAKSQKEWGLNSVISEITSHGRVLAVGTDKRKIPGFIELFSAKTGARIYNPPNDLKVAEKRELTGNFNTDNEHKLDAIASALFAYKKLKPLLLKIGEVVKNGNKYHIQNEIRELVLSKNISIHEAIGIIDATKEKIQIRDTSAKREFKEEDYFRLYEKFKSLKNDNRLLKQYNDKLLRNLAEIESKQNSIQNFRRSETPSILNFKERRLKHYLDLLRDKEMAISFMKSNVMEMTDILANINQYYVLKKLDTLGSSQFETRKMLLNIQGDDMLLVDNPNIVSKTTIDELKDKITIIVHNKPIGKKIKSYLPFIFIESKKIKVKDFGIIAVADKKSLDEEKNKSDVILKIVEKYKEERAQLI